MSPVDMRDGSVDDSTLILYYYDDGLAADERTAIAAALENDTALAARYRDLCRLLERFDEPPAVSAPPRAVTRWQRSIERAAGRGAEPRRSGGKGWHFPSFAWGALAAAVVLAVAVRVWFADGAAPVMQPPPQDEPIAGDPPQTVRAVPVAFSRGLELHLRDSRRNLLGPLEDDDRRLLLEDLIRQNRQFERAALENNAEDVARVLRAFEPILVRLAKEDLSAEDAAALKSKLVFELNVMLTKMSAAESHDAQTI